MDDAAATDLSIATERLVGRPISMEDVPALQTLHQKPPVAEHIGGTWTEDRSHQFVKGCVEHWQTYGYGQWMFYLQDTGEMAGRSGLRHYYMDGRDEIELLYALEPALWGKGLGSEAARAIVAWGFERQPFESIVSFTLPDNPRSRRVMENAGLTFEKEVTRLEPPDYLVFRISRSDWAASARSGA